MYTLIQFEVLSWFCRVEAGVNHLLERLEGGEWLSRVIWVVKGIT